MSIEDNKKLLIKLNQDKNKDSINNRIQFVKTLLNNNALQPIIDFNNTDTENFINLSRDDDSDNSHDTRISLKKEVYKITDIISQMGGTLKYIKSGTTGHTFKGIEKDKYDNTLYEYAVKVVAMSTKDKYGGIHDTRRPENAELMMIKLLSYFIVKKITPHIVLPIGTFDTSIKHFTNLIEQGYIIKNRNNRSSYDRYQEFINRYNNGEYYDDVSVLISEWANRGDLSTFIGNYCHNFTTIHWKVIFFQLISTLAVIQYKYPSFRHNDLKANNVLVTKISKDVILSYNYTVFNDVYTVPNIGYQIKLWDFDFACIPGVVDNKKVLISCGFSRKINVGLIQNRYYDLHFFFNTLIKKRGFFPQLMTSNIVAQEVKDFILSIVPKEYQEGSSVSDGGRILHNMEYVLPVDVLRYNPFFAEFRTVGITTSYIKQPSNSQNHRSTNHETMQLNKIMKNIESKKLQSGPKINDFLKGGSSSIMKSRARINNKARKDQSSDMSNDDSNISIKKNNNPKTNNVSGSKTNNVSGSKTNNVNGSKTNKVNGSKTNKVNGSKTNKVNGSKTNKVNGISAVISHDKSKRIIKSLTRENTKDNMSKKYKDRLNEQCKEQSGEQVYDNIKCESIPRKKLREVSRADLENSKSNSGQKIKKNKKSLSDINIENILMGIE
jgi:hypothetical protein